MKNYLSKQLKKENFKYYVLLTFSTFCSLDNFWALLNDLIQLALLFSRNNLAEVAWSFLPTAAGGLYGGTPSTILAPVWHSLEHVSCCLSDKWNEFSLIITIRTRHQSKFRPNVIREFPIDKNFQQLLNKSQEMKNSGQLQSAGHLYTMKRKF